MGLKEQINEDMKEYMRNKNTISLNAVRMLKSDIKNAEINTMKELDEASILKVIQSSIKKRKDSIEQFTNADRIDLAEKESAEIEALQKYMPKQLSNEELIAIISDVIANTEEKGAKAFGLVMKSVTTKVSGLADGKVVSKLVKDMLDGNC